MTSESIIEFPTSFPIKALGKDAPEFRKIVLEIVATHASFNPETDVKEQVSGKGNFISITVTFMAEDQIQLDTIYQSLHDHELILMVF
jgi:putative lipoic acid-binding regulatory protein